MFLCKQDKPLALASVRKRGGRRQRCRPALRRKLFYGCERNHFAANFGEPLRPALDGDKSRAIDRHDIAGVVPAVAHRLQHAGLIRLEVTEHDVWSAHKKAAAIGDTFDVLQVRFDPWQNPAHCARAAEHGRVKRKHRSRFGDAIAFQNAQAEFLHVKRARRWPDGFSARHDIAD